MPSTSISTRKARTARDGGEGPPEDPLNWIRAEPTIIQAMQPSCPTACSDWLLWNPPQIAPTEKATKPQRITLDGPPVLVRYLVLVLEKEVRTDKRRMRHPLRPQCASSTCPDVAHRRVRSMLGLACSVPRLTAEMFPVLLRAIQSFHLDRSTRSTAPINGRASVSHSLYQSSGTTRGSGGQTSRLPHSSGLYPPPPPKIVTGGGR